MYKLLITRPNHANDKNPGGVSMFCMSLYDLFVNDSDIEVLNIESYPHWKFRLVHGMYKPGIYKRRISECHPDIVHINAYHSFEVIQAFWAAKKAKAKIVYTAHFHPFEYLNHPILAKLYFNLLVKPLVIKYADVVTTLNNEDTAFFQKFHPNVIRIPHWSRFDDYNGEPIQKNPKMILFVGRFNSSNKGFEHLYSIPEGKYEIHCVGKGEVKKRSDMVFHINISNEELAILYKQASLVVVPSYYEAFSYVTLESLYYNTPVVISDKVRIGDYLNEFPFCTVFPYNDCLAFNKAIDETIGVKVDREAVLDIFSAQSIKQKYKDIYMGLFNSGH